MPFLHDNGSRLRYMDSAGGNESLELFW